LFRARIVEEFGADYVTTLRNWHRNFMAAWPRLSQRYSETTRRMFEYYFLSVAGAFRSADLLHYHLEFDRSSGNG
jgi:cyclopropane-fatty-acyl-phospholipid synthase